MRSLATLGILSESDSRQFSLTPLGEALKADAPGAARSSVLTIASDWWFRGFGELMYSVQTGKSGFEKALGEPIFDYLGHNPEDASLFQRNDNRLPWRRTAGGGGCLRFSRTSGRSSMWAARPDTCSPRSCNAIRRRAASSSICRMWCGTRRR